MWVYTLGFRTESGQIRTLAVAFSSEERYKNSKRLFFRGNKWGFEDIGETLSRAFLRKYGERVSSDDNDELGVFISRVEGDDNIERDLTIDDTTVDDDFEGTSWDPRSSNYVFKNK